MGYRKPVSHPWEYFVEAARWLHGIESVVIIGGEPLVHPRFDEFAPRFRELFGCRELIVWTNGYQVERHAEALKCFDAVYASLYDSNRAEVDYIKAHFPHATMEQPHIPLSHRGSGQICERGVHGPITYADGRIYGCCVAMALPGGVGITPGPKWRAEVLATPLPCEECCFA